MDDETRIAVGRAEMAKMLSIGLRTLDQRVKDGLVRSRKFGGRRLFYPEHVTADVFGRSEYEGSRNGEHQQ